MVISQGEIWWADVPVPIGSGSGYRRTIEVLQANSLNQSRIGTIVCVSISSGVDVVPGR